jgi:hypothetical protein
LKELHPFPSPKLVQTVPILAVLEEDFKGLAKYFGSPKTASQALRGKLYRVFEIPKKDGTFRVIEAPRPKLKVLQRAILTLLYEQAAVWSNETQGFCPKRDNVSNAEVHREHLARLKRGTIIGQDLEKAFPSVTHEQVRKALRKYLPHIDGAKRQLIACLCTKDGKLSTGSPCSPMLLNLVLKEMDERITEGLRKKGGIYTRYADDCSISIERKHKKFAKRLLRREIKRAGMTPHPEKSFSVTPARATQRAEITGLKVNEASVRTSKRWRNKLRKVAFTLWKSSVGGNRLRGMLRYEKRSSTYRANLETLIGRKTHARLHRNPFLWQYCTS